MYTLEQIGEFYKKAGLTSLSLKDGNFEISMSSLAGNVNIQPVQVMPIQNVEAGNSVQTAATNEKTADDELIIIYSPMVGIFDNGEAAIEKPYVKKGDMVKKGDIVGAIEAMKMFNDIVAGQDGIVEEICVSKGDMVEFNQPLFKLRPIM